jgi:hypothetical protein
MKKLAITYFVVCLLAFAAIFLTSFKSVPASGAPTMKRTYGGVGSDFSVYEYKASDGSIYVIVQGKGETGPVAVHSK